MGVVDLNDGKRYRRRRGDLVVDFIEHFCVHTIGELAEQPLLLEDWQKEFIRDLYIELWDERRGKWVYLFQSALLGVPRGAGKSTLSAAICLAELAPMPWNTEAPRVLISAVSRENAMQVYGPAADMVRLSPALQDLFLANKNTIWCEDNRGLLWRVSADGKGQFGHIPSFIVRDELHAWTSDKHVALSEALQTALAKRFNARSLSVTTAGHDKLTILGRLYDESLKSDYREDPRPGFVRVLDLDRRFLMHWYEAPDDMPVEDPATWHAAHPASWIDEEAVRAQLNDPSISIDEFSRQWLNRWTKSKKAWFAIDAWKLCGPVHNSDFPEIPDGSKIFLGVDGAWSDDCTALVWSWMQDNEDDTPVVVRSHIWGTVEELGEQYHTFVPGGNMDMKLVRDFIHEELKPRYQVYEIAYDPKFFTDTAKRLSDDGFTMVDFPRGGEVMDEAVMDFYRLVNGGRIRHDGDEAYAGHVESTAAVQTERTWKIFKLKQSRKIDATVATIMSVARCRLYTQNASYSYAFRSRKSKDAEAEKEA